eukprot:PITA_02692
MATIFSVASPLDESPPIDAGETLRKPLSLWPRLYNSTVTNALWQVRLSILEKHVLNFSLRPPQSQWPVAPKTKSPSHSRTSILYNFSSDHILREQYRDPYNEVRIGKLLEDLDALAGTIALKHCSDYDHTPRPLLLVTASLDKMVLKKPIRVDTDLKVVGAVTWVGRSSIEIQMIITELSGGDTGSGDSVALITNFTFVSRDLRTGKSTLVNRLVPQTDTEKALLAEGEERDVRRKKERQRRGKEFEERNRLHGDGNGDGERVEALMREGRVLCDMPAALADRDSILIKDTSLVNALVCQPQERNLHGRIFGGFLMHRAFELAFSTCYAFVGRAPIFLKVDRVDFLRPVSNTSCK